MDWTTQIAQTGITSLAALIASYFGAKWAESRKLQARFEKLDQIREEMREVTRVQEEIKRQLQTSEWNRQTLWRQRFDSYTELLRASTDYLNECHALHSLLSSGDSRSGQIDASGAELRRIRAATFKAMLVVEIFGNEKVLATLKRFFAAAGEKQSRQPGESAAALSREIEAIRELQTFFVAAAREQLKGGIDS